MADSEDKIPDGEIVPSIDHVDGVQFDCHVCGKSVSVGTEASGQKSIFHNMPMCDTFRDTDALDFLSEARRHYERLSMN